MIKLGRINKLKITEVKKDSYLFSEDRHIFSVSKYQLPGSRNIGDEIEGFIYSDKDGKFCSALFVLIPYNFSSGTATLSIVYLSISIFSSSLHKDKNYSIIPAREKC